MESLLQPDDPPPFEIVQGDGRSPFLFIADHAGKQIPRVLGDLGVAESDRLTHIAWDIGIYEVAWQLARSLEAFLAVQTYSRLVIDCNRPLIAPDSIVCSTAGVEVPGNRGISEREREQRINEIFLPYHSKIEAELERRKRAGQTTVLVAMHSFTPVYMGSARPWQIGLLFNRDERLARVLKQLLAEDGSVVVGENQPYAVSDTSDYSVVTYGEQRNLHHIEIELRQDLIASREGQIEWATRLERLLAQAVCQLPTSA
jgi:predicted N-formylglutamate amidohydrolase